MSLPLLHCYYFDAAIFAFIVDVYYFHLHYAAIIGFVILRHWWPLRRHITRHYAIWYDAIFAISLIY